MKEIKLTQSKVALVDDKDFEELNQFKWYAHFNGKHFYARRTVERKGIFMHRVILNAKKGEICDHLNRYGLDNTRKNLRIATCSENNQNSKVRTGKFRGVSWHLMTSKWKAQIKKDSLTSYLGVFDNEEQAAAAYNKKAILFYGKHARLNEIPRT